MLEDICDFIPANLTIADVAGISELQYYIRSAIPFGSPVNTNYHLLRKVRHGFPNKEEDTALAEERGKPGGAAPQGCFVQDPFLHSVNCYAEVFMEIPDTTLSGIVIDPKAVTVYPTTRVYGGVSVQKEVLTGKYVIWNMAGEVRGSHNELQFDD